MSNEIFVAFATQKGSIGKSTVTAFAANYLYNVKGHNVAVIDCDDPQPRPPMSACRLSRCLHRQRCVYHSAYTRNYTIRTSIRLTQS